MLYRVLIVTCSCLLLSACLRASKPQTMDTRCTQALDTARQLYRDNAKTTAASAHALAGQLITAARIARQQQKYVSCLNKSSRAINLLNPAATTNGEPAGR